MASSSNSAEIGIRVFLEDAASAGLFALDSNLGRVGVTAQKASLLFGGLSQKIVAMAAVTGLVGSFFLFGGSLVYATQQAMGITQALTDVGLATNLTGQQLAQLQPTLLDLGGKSIFSLQELADGMSVLGQYGFKTTEQIKLLSDAGVKLAEVTGSQTTAAFKLLAVTMASFNIPASLANQTAALLFYSVEHGTPNIAALTTAIGGLGGAAGTLHISLQQLLPALDTISIGMGSASTAAAGLRYFILSIVHPTAQAAAEMKKIGLSAFDAQGKFVGLQPLLQSLADKLQGLSDKAKADILGPLFSIRGGTAVRELVNQIDKYVASSKQAADVTKAQKDLDAAVTLVMGNLGNVFKEVVTNLQDFAGEIGQSVLPQIVGFAQKGILPLVTQLRHLASDPATARIYANFLLLGTAISGVGVIIIGIVATPIGAFLAIMVAVMAAVAGVTLLVLNWHSVMLKLQPVIDGVKSALPAVTAGLLTLAGGFLAIRAVSIAGQISSTVSWLIFLAQYSAASAASIFTTLIPALWAKAGALGAAKVAWLAGLLPAMAAGIAQAWNATAAFVAGLIPALVRMAVSSWTAVAGFVAGIIPALIAASVAAWNASVAFIVGLGPALIRLAVSAWTASVGFIVGLGPALVAMAVSAWTATVGFFAGLIPALIGVGIATWNAAIATLAFIGPYILIGIAIAAVVVGLVILIQHLGGLNFLLKAGQAVWQAILPALQEAGAAIKGAFMEAVKQLQPVWQQLVQAFNQAKPFLMWLGIVLGVIIAVAVAVFIGAIRGAINVISALIAAIIHIAAGIIQVFAGIIQFFLGFFTVIHGIFTGNTKEIQQGFQQMGQGILNIFKGLWNAVSAVFIGAFNIIKGFVTGFIQGIIGFFQNLAGTLVHHSIIPDMLNAIISAILGFIPRAIAGFAQFVSQMISKAQSLPGLILKALGNLASLLYSAGQNIVQGLINGFQSMVQNLFNTISNALTTVRNMFPHSPAKLGPLTDLHTWMPNVVKMLSDTAETAAPGLHASMSRVAGAAKSGFLNNSAGGGSGGAGTNTYNLVLDGRVVMSFVHNQLTGELSANGVGRMQR